MDWTSIAAGAISKLFGGKSPGQRNTELAMAKLNEITQAGLELYKNSNLEESDRRAVNTYRESAIDDAMNILSGYDARTAAAGSPIYKGSTVKDRARSQIAGDVSQKVSDYQMNLDTSRANRQAALLPNPSSAIAGLQGAGAMDQFANQNYAANQNGLFDLAYTIIKGLPFNNVGIGGGVVGGNDTAASTNKQAAVSASTSSKQLPIWDDLMRGKYAPSGLSLVDRFRNSIGGL